MIFIFKNNDSFKYYIKSESQKANINTSSGYTYFFTRQFLTNVFQQSDSFVITGNVTQSTIFGKFIRPITDIDIISGENISTILDIFYETLKIENNDIKYNLINRPTISKSGVCNITISASIHKIKHPIGLDIKAEAPHIMVKKEFPKLFTNDKDLEIQAISHESHLGRKLYVIARGLYMMSKNHTVTRFKDFYDVYKMSDIPFDLEETKNYYQKLMIDNSIPSDIYNIIDNEFILEIVDSYYKNMNKLQIKDSNIITEVQRIKELMIMFEKKKIK